MPTKPLRPCSHPGCPNLVSSGSYCDKHKRECGYDSRRGSAHSRGYNNRWKKARLQYLKEHPLCVECAKDKRTTAATVVDHTIPHKGDQQLFWDRNNWQALCGSCHSIKTAKEDGGFGNEMHL